MLRFCIAIILAIGSGLAHAAQPDLSKVPGVVINHSPASTGRFIGSPSIAALADGTYVVTHDFFGRATKEDEVAVFSSADRGRSWRQIASIDGAFWSGLFVHRGSLYLMGVNRGYGNVVIRRSDDAGKTWTNPKDPDSGLLLTGAKYHTAPVPVIEHNGRLWRAMEDARGPGGWGSHFRAFVMSAPVDADLLKADSWTSSNPIGRDPTWLNGSFGGWLEGNAVITPDGEIVDILRVDNKPAGETAAIIHISNDGKSASFDPKRGFIRLPGGTKKFTIRYDQKSKLYWTLTNPIQPADVGHDPASTRNALALMSSWDLRDWMIKSIVLYHPDREKHAFQYVDWLFEHDDIIAVSRTAFDDGLGGAKRAHDANLLTFHRIQAFRTLKTADVKTPMP